MRVRDMDGHIVAEEPVRSPVEEIGVVHLHKAVGHDRLDGPRVMGPEVGVRIMVEVGGKKDS